MKNQCKRRVFILGLLLPLAFSVPAIAQPTPAAQSTSYPRNQALYVTLRDGTKIAIDVWLPEKLAPGAKIPTILRATPYQRAFENADKDIVTKLPPKVQFRPTGDNLLDTLDFQNQFQFKQIEVFNNNGYAFVTVDFRGRGASFGTAPNVISPKDGEDLSEIVDWVVAQPWSNRKVGAEGISLPGTAASLLALTNNPAVKAIVPRHEDFDFYAEFFPGGIFNVTLSSKANVVLPFSDTSPCSFGQKVELGGREICEGIKKAGFSGVKPVDEDKDKRLLAEAVQLHTSNFDFNQAFQSVTYRDDAYGNLTLRDISPYNFKSEIERSNVAIYSWAGWLDSDTPAGVVSRFMTFNNPQKAVIGPWVHGDYNNANPFSPPDTPVKPSIEEQFQDITQFFDAYLKDNAGAPPVQRELKYYTMVEDKWKTTDVWPPKGVVPQRLFFAANNDLTKAPLKEQTGEDKYTVNFETTTGKSTRWTQNFTLNYDNRAEEDKKLLIYNSKAVKKDTEITGNAVVNLLVSSTADDGAFIVYLEDVAPDGKVTYITEGQLRPLHRKVSREAPPYAVFGPYHSYKKQDGLPFKPGEVTELTFELLPTSVVIQKGHQIRVAIAGHDKDTFARYPAEGTPTIGVQRNAVYASYIDIPVMR